MAARSHRLVALAALTLALACRGATHPRAHPGQGEGGEPAATTGEGERGADVGARPKPPPCAEAGVPWDGRPSGCAYEHERCCYPDAESACAAARCPAAACDVLESYPAQVRCRATP
ncbi:MAG: hypothetical protein K1X88_27475 [Nannocystaceae bacterium]|nr:hypothetical protein [Nannocystaceae bacterium]